MTELGRDTALASTRRRPGLAREDAPNRGGLVTAVEDAVAVAFREEWGRIVADVDRGDR